MIEAKFTCKLCGELAALLQLTTDNRLIQDGFIAQITERVSEKQAVLLTSELEQTNIAAIYELDRFWAPFYCPECKAVYCKKHWRTEIEFDDDLPGWYDCTYGTCPAGHRRIVDD